MAQSRTYKVQGVVLRKTKLAEKDLVVSVLLHTGALLRAVAKGARKPGGSFAARLELFSANDLMVAQGRTLDVITEARLVSDAPPVSFGLEQSACASAIAELVCHIAQEDLEQPRLYDMTLAAFRAIGSTDAEHALLITAADLLKTLALAGFRPSLDTCVRCGRNLSGGDERGIVRVSVEEGGAICPTCPQSSDAIFVDANACAWVRALLAARFSEVAAMEFDASTAFELLHFTRQWARHHTGRDVKSLDFLFTSGLF